MPNYPIAPTLTIAGRVFTDLVNLIHLAGFAQDATNKYTTPRQDNASSGYQVPGGKTLRIWAVAFSDVNGTGGTPAHLGNLGYNDVDLGVSGTTTPTNPVLQYGSATVLTYVSGGGIVPQQAGFACNFTVPTGKFPYWINDAGVGTIKLGVELFGYLE